jgi:hypothetical protein
MPPGNALTGPASPRRSAGDGYTLHATTTGLVDADSDAFRITA